MANSAVGALLIFIGLVLLISGGWNFLLNQALSQVPVVGDLFSLIAPSVSRDQVLFILIGLLLIMMGALLARKSKTK